MPSSSFIPHVSVECSLHARHWGDVFLPTHKTLQMCHIDRELHIMYRLTTSVVGECKLRAYLSFPCWFPEVTLSLQHFHCCCSWEHLAPALGNRIQVTSPVVISGRVTWAFPSFPGYVEHGQHSLLLLHSLHPGLFLGVVLPVRCHLWFLFPRHCSGWNVTEALHCTRTPIPWQVSHLALSLQHPREPQPELPSNVFRFLVFKTLN